MGYQAGHPFHIPFATIFLGFGSWLITISDNFTFLIGSILCGLPGSPQGLFLFHLFLDKKSSGDSTRAIKPFIYWMFCCG